MQLKSNISFNDTAVAFQSKSDKALAKANFVFSVVNNPHISKISMVAVKAALAMRLPIKWIIKRTVFEHFCGGETIQDSLKSIKELNEYNVGSILDYSVEGVDTTSNYEKVKKQIIDTIVTASKTEGIPFSVFKVTGIGSTSALRKRQSKEKFNKKDHSNYEKLKGRVEDICEAAYQHNVPILIDAEESWIQDSIDELVYEMMAKYNKEKAIVFNTYQLYRSDMLGNLKKAFHDAAMGNYHLGAKLVRGAYMEKERERAEDKGYKSPIHANKDAVDKDYNEALSFCMDNKQRISFMCGSHNEYSNLYLTLLMEKHGMKNDDPRVFFAQLYGMSDNISFNLAQAGYNVGKYLPYGPVRAVMPYLFRRATENTSVEGQSSRELTLIRAEMKRRRELKKDN
ncbi:proline dehydrogenase family protein [Fulvivirga sediminis]|uniref:Proline dehydrogenase family protein n=1 Tax=Fulvivirga sediminis TaxID=2803949 RepID=A0A937JZD1_9BACT|nr:proline dehydrogenase family protein [Fulvivirga sediminis]MBL3656544.1 proline dehydrogenase family protein [Fulvivirga sediminis]